MRLGVAIEDTWDFFHEVYADFAGRYRRVCSRAGA